MTWMLLAALLAAAPPLDGRGHPVKDDLLEQLAGSWKLTRTAAGGRPAQNDVTAEWVLDHQFLRICFENGPYQAHVYRPRAADLRGLPAPQLRHRQPAHRLSARISVLDDDSARLRAGERGRTAAQALSASVLST